MSYTTVSHCGNDHQLWLSSIDFYEGEFDILEARLLEIVRKNNGQEAMKGVEHFQNQFIIHRENIDELRHSIHTHDSKVANNAQHHAGKMDEFYVDDHDKLKDRFHSFERIANELRHEFNAITSKWM